MDQFQLCTLEDAPAIATELRAGHNVVFGYQFYNTTTYSIFIGQPPVVIGQTPYGGQPYGRYIVGVVYVGLFHFDLHPDEPLHTDYVSEKLHLDAYDAQAVTTILNAVREQLAEEIIET